MPSLAQLEASLPPRVLHAFQAYTFAFDSCDPTMTVRELRTAIARIYGRDVDEALEKHFADRRAAVLPQP